MSISGTNADFKCLHSNHLFSHPLCKEQSLLKRVAIVAFHVLTLGIPLAIQRMISCCFPRRASEPKDGDLQATGIKSVQQDRNIKPYSELGQKALEFARKKLEENQDTGPMKFRAFAAGEKTHQPINLEIARLTTLSNSLYRDFKDLMAKNAANPWSNEELVQAADQYFKIDFAISNLTLDDLKAFTETLSLNGENRTFAKALTEQDSYQYRSFYFCTSTYHWIRGKTPKDQVKLFYKKGTIQHTWNTLYNEYCNRVRLYVSEKELQLADQRHVKWTKKDTGVKTFARVPDTLPT